MSGTAPDKCAPAQGLFIAVPAYTGTVYTETSSSITEAASVLRKGGLAVATAYADGNCYIQEARNDLVADFLASGYPDMLFWDADVGAEPETVVRLVMSTRPLAAAIYPKKTDGLEFPIEFLAGERWTDKEGLLGVKMVPTGMLRINRAVFDHLRQFKRHARQYLNYSNREQHAYFTTQVRERFYGEDVEFCRKWREVGGKIHIVPDATLAHCGKKVWTANIGEAMKAGSV